MGTSKSLLIMMEHGKIEALFMEVTDDDADPTYRDLAAYTQKGRISGNQIEAFVKLSVLPVLEQFAEELLFEREANGGDS